MRRSRVKSVASCSRQARLRSNPSIIDRIEPVLMCNMVVSRKEILSFKVNKVRMIGRFWCENDWTVMEERLWLSVDSWSVA